jgi:hypothetical protein
MATMYTLPSGKTSNYKGVKTIEKGLFLAPLLVSSKSEEVVEFLAALELYFQRVEAYNNASSSGDVENLVSILALVSPDLKSQFLRDTFPSALVSLQEFYPAD